MKKERILPGTEQMRRYLTMCPNLRGIEHYGISEVNGHRGCYKIGWREGERAERIGYCIVKEGTSYVYVVKGGKN